ncbi:hypothetical protein BX666DRAFT_2093656 [Dichotomocladium elegans]|nr:hypothetical protein BX666DRAFT_2093656 [Dichotomocladium elegans]
MSHTYHILATSPDYFFSFTENAYEISIVANQATIDNDLLPFLATTNCADMGTSPDIFRVLQVDDSDGQEASGKRISDLSEPLAQGKFSIFYMSTYQTDLVLVKERRMRQAVQSLMDHGFEFDQDSLDMYHQEPSLVSSTSSTQLPDDDTEIESSVLANELRCAGLNPHYRSTWAMTMLKIMSFPELIEGYSRTNPEEALFQDEDTVPLRVIQVNLAGANLERCGIVRSISQPLAEEHINLLYLSTYKTANIIVSADDLEQADEILRPDLEKMREMLSEVVFEPLQ